MGLRYQLPVTQPAMPSGFPQMRRVHHAQDVYAQFARTKPSLSSRPEHRRLSRATILLSGFASAIAVTTLGFLLLSHRSPLPSVAGIPQFQFGALSSGTKSAFLSSVQEAKQRDIAGKVHFVTEIIRSVQPNTKRAKALARTIVEESRAADYDPLFVAAIIKAESTFRRGARSHRGAVGLMQLLPSTAKYISRKRNINWQGISTLSDPRYNLRLGIAYLQYLEEKYDGNRRTALIAYNWGPGKLFLPHSEGLLHHVLHSGMRAPFCRITRTGLEIILIDTINIAS